MTTDRELVDRVQAGELEAFAVLLSRYERSVWAVVHAEVREPRLARHVTLSTLRRAYRKLSRLPVTSEFGPWLLRIARRQAFHILQTRPISSGATGCSGSVGDEFEASGPDWIQNERLLGLLTRLNEKERRLVGLYYFDNLNLSEISDVVGQPVARIKRLISHAVYRLEDWWEREHDQ